MRYLNQLKPHEKFVASGVYHTVMRESGEKREEAWSIHELPDDTWFIRADYQAQGRDGLNRLVEVLYEPSHVRRTVNSGVTRLNIFEYDSKTRVRENLVFFDDYVQVGFSVNDAERVYLEFELPADYVVAGACYVMRGLNVPHLASKVDNPSPMLLDFDWKMREIVWWSNFEITKHPVTEISVDGKPLIATHYDWHYENNDLMELWLDVHDVMLKLTSTHEDTLLKAYSRRPEAKL